jgi:His/Glu/Gln/Arg/opine family amino acid ABC transporter permease subunit
MFDWHIFLKGFASMVTKIPMTLAITGVSAVSGFFIALIFALVKINKVRVLHRIVDGFISFLRGTPVILQLYLVYYVIPIMFDTLAVKSGWSFRSTQIPIFALVVFALGFNLSSYLTETIRSGLEAVDKGEVEAALSLGMTGGALFRRVVFPEAIRIFIPNFSSNLIACLHGSSLAFYVTLVEITGEANIFAQYNWRYLETFLGAGILYWAITAGIETLTHLAERYLNRAEREIKKNPDNPANIKAYQIKPMNQEA